MPPKKTPSRKRAAKKTASKKVSNTDEVKEPDISKVSEHVEQLFKTFSTKQTDNPHPLRKNDLEQRMIEFDVKFAGDSKKILSSINRIDPRPTLAATRLPEDVKKTLEALKPGHKRFHGAKVSLAWFPFPSVFSRCADKFGYITPLSVRNATKLPFNFTNQVLLGELGGMMGDPGRDPSGDSLMPSGFTYFGQFVDHDITLDVSSSLESEQDANTINNMRTPALDLDSLYGRGPALDPFLYAFPTSDPPTAIRFQLGTNSTGPGPGGPGGAAGFPGMVTQTNFDVPRMHNPLDPPSSSNTAIIGDPRNDENLIVVQFHHAMLKFHNKVVDLLVVAGFSGDIFVEAKKIVTQHYQWAVVHDFLKRICGTPAVNNALSGVSAPIGSAFRMPVEFSVAAYRFGHSMIRDQYWVNFNFPFASLAQVFQFNRNPNLPVLSSWVVDFNAFFDTGISVPIHNKAKKIDSFLASGLESIPGGSGIMAILATRNLRRGLALGLPSGQGMANHFGIAPLTATELKQGLLPDEIAVLDSNGGLLLSKTPLWYYILRESAVQKDGEQLGDVGAKIVADTFVRILKRDGSSFLNVSGGFTPMLPSVTPGDFTLADLVIFAGVTQP
ncbi:peroxidase family protein [Chryseolinea lacunae]|uniref:Peroxidase n=1 Tax=Chryseolinea lacunae TaxID=2801331 RepID=A0ABS1KWS7_9BACT|nr:heme peroxidase family protein [Chryseolinea lacunae]MBL0743905.1 hypothetical protein [Chryseolinea lacunae]